MKQAVSEINFPGKNFVLCGYRTKTCTPPAKKTPKNGSRLGSRDAINVINLLIYIGKRVVGGTGLEPVTKAL